MRSWLLGSWIWGAARGVAVGFLVCGLFAGCSRQPRINLNPYEALGAIAGEETSKLIGHRGEVVLVAVDPGEDRDPVQESELRAFEALLTKSGGARVAKTVLIKQDPMQRMATGGAMPAAELGRLHKDHGTAAAWVFFIPFPVLSPADAARLREQGTKVVVASACLPGYKELLRSKIIHLALVPKRGGGPEPAKAPSTLREWFDAEYLLATPETADSLPF
jgi:hypothetical protein